MARPTVRTDDGLCLPCDKFRYLSRKKARRAARATSTA